MFSNTAKRIMNVTRYLILFYNLQKTLSAKIDVADFKCTEGYPIDVLAYKFSCNGGQECSFGDSAVFEGQFQYTNLTSNTAYMSANVSVASFSQPMFEFQEIDLCGNFTSDWGGECPEEEGVYDVSISFQMPQSGSMDWFLTGFRAKSQIEIYSDEYKTDVLANCYATLVTDTQGYVAAQYLNETVPAPNAFHLLISLWVVLGIAAFIFVYRKVKSADDADSKTQPLIELDETAARQKKYDDIENARSHDANSVYNGGDDVAEYDDAEPAPALPSREKNVC